MKQLSTHEQRTLHHYYKKNDLYRQWLPILSELNRNHGEADAQTLWHMANQLVVRLRGEQSFREHDISPIYNELLSDCSQFDATERTAKLAQRSAKTVMCVLLTMLMNAVEAGHEDECFSNEPMCMAILDILSGDNYFQSLMNLFFKRDVGYDGNKVVIAPKDPMQEEAMFENMDEVAKADVEQMVEKVVSRTNGLKAKLKDGWGAWCALWLEVCMDKEFILLLKKEEPRTTDWGINEKMVFNVVGMVRKLINMTDSVNVLNDAIGTKNRRSYISNITDFNGTDSVFDREKYDRMMHLIEKHFLSTGDK